MITSFCGKIIRETKYKLLLQLAYFYRRCLKKFLVCFLMGHSVYILLSHPIYPVFQSYICFCLILSSPISSYIISYLIPISSNPISSQSFTIISHPICSCLIVYSSILSCIVSNYLISDFTKLV